jgi:MFS transporter, FSR family, fosmidomycin resistance protein
MACAGILFSVYNTGAFSTAVVAYLFIAYNLLAFGLQIFVGFITDYLKAPKLSALVGLIITGIGTVVLLPFPVAAVILAGVGNALFHVGGGVISLNLTPQKATAPGIFVAPGALGLMAGTLLGKNGDFVAWPLLLAIAVLGVTIFLVKKPVMYPEQPQSALKLNIKAEYVIYLVLFVIAVRSLVGFAVSFPWKTDITLLVWLTVAIALGKGLGGFLADRFGWTKVTVGSLLVSIPLLNLGVDLPVLGMIGMFLFNITMPVTLTLVSNMLPGKPGTAFGLACMALVLGTLPSFSELKAGLNNTVFIDIVIAISAVTLLLALRYYYREPGEVKGKSLFNSSYRNERQAKDL